MKTFAVLVPVLGRPDAVKKTIDAFLASGSERDASLLFIASDTDGPEIDALGDCPTCVVPPTDRPQEDEDAAALSREFGKALNSGTAAMSGTAKSA